MKTAVAKVPVGYSSAFQHRQGFRVTPSCSKDPTNSQNPTTSLFSKPYFKINNHRQFVKTFFEAPIEHFVNPHRSLTKP